MLPCRLSSFQAEAGREEAEAVRGRHDDGSALELFGQVDDAADRVGLAEKAAAWKPGLVQCFGCFFQEYGGALLKVLAYLVFAVEA